VFAGKALGVIESSFTSRSKIARGRTRSPPFTAAGVCSAVSQNSQSGIGMRIPTKVREIAVTRFAPIMNGLDVDGTKTSRRRK